MRMTRFFFITVLISMVVATQSLAQGFKPLPPAYSPQEMNPVAAATSSLQEQPFRIITPLLNATGQQVSGDPIIGKVDAVVKQLIIHWPQDSINLSQLQTILTQNPSMNSVKLLFPNRSEWMITQNEFQDLYNKFTSSAGGFGFGMGGGNMPELVLTSLASQAGIDPSMAVLPITAIKQGFSGVGETLEPVLRELRYQQMALGEYLPDWLKDIWLAVYNFVMPYYYALVDWLKGLFS